MGAIGQSTRIGQSGLLAAAFTTPFMITVGTGGYTQASYQETTGNNMFVSLEQPLSLAERKVSEFTGIVLSIKDNFGLGVDQMSLLFDVSRPTIYSWLKGDVTRIQSKHRAHVVALSSILKDRISEENSMYLGRLLRRKLDKDAIKLTNSLSQKNITLAEIEPLFDSIDFKLEGIKRSERLSLELSDKRALI